MSEIQLGLARERQGEGKTLVWLGQHFHRVKLEPSSANPDEKKTQLCSRHAGVHH